MWKARKRQIAVAAVLGVALISGCDGQGPSEPEIGPTYYTPYVFAVTAPDSIAAGDSLEVKIHWVGGSCIEFGGFTLLRPDDQTCRLIPEAVDWSGVPGVFCLSSYGLHFQRFVISDPPTRPFRLIVESGEGPMELLIEGGATPSDIERHYVRIEDRETNEPIPDVKVVIRETLWGDPEPGPVIAELQTDERGVAESTIACGDSARIYEVELHASDLWLERLWFWISGARCGVPERTLIRV